VEPKQPRRADEEGKRVMIDMGPTDRGLQRRVSDALQRDTRLRGASIEVRVEDGFVTLSGIVFDWHRRIVAQEVARRVTGVQEVANEIHVPLPRVG
jgi:osmotically-inducible protein OsmY